MARLRSTTRHSPDDGLGGESRRAQARRQAEGVGLTARRSLMCGMLVASALTGCAAGGRMNAIRPDLVGARPAPSIKNTAVADLLGPMNRNARSVQALRASTTVSATGWNFGTGANGDLALERPRNFKLELERGMGGRKVVDVGSNADEYWFWKEDNEEKSIYVGHYDAQGEAASDFAFHPDWIVEALGLRGATADEMAQAKLTRGDAGMLELTQYRSDGRGGTRLKRTLFDERTRQVKQHIFYGADNKTPVATVYPSNIGRFAINSADGSATSTVELPQQVVLRLTPPSRTAKDVVEMRIVLQNVKLNPEFTDVNRQALFTVPSYPGYEVVELSPRRSQYTREATGEAPEPSRRASHEAILESPVPMGREGAWLHQRDPLPLAADLPSASNSPTALEPIVRPRVPQPPVVR